MSKTSNPSLQRLHKAREAASRILCGVLNGERSIAKCPDAVGLILQGLCHKITEVDSSQQSTDGGSQLKVPQSSLCLPGRFESEKYIASTLFASRHLLSSSRGLGIANSLGLLTINLPFDWDTLGGILRNVHPNRRTSVPGVCALSSIGFQGDISRDDEEDTSSFSQAGEDDNASWNTWWWEDAEDMEPPIHLEGAKVRSMSPSEIEWERQKSETGARSKAIDKIMELIGLEDLKAQILDIRAKIEVGRRQNLAIEKEIFGAAFIGSPGTGRTTVMELYAKFLQEAQIVQPEVSSWTGAQIICEGVMGVDSNFYCTNFRDGGVFIVDDSRPLADDGNEVMLDYLRKKMRTTIGSVVFTFAGDSDLMKNFLQYDPGFQHLLPYQFRFPHFSKDELHLILQALLRKKYKSPIRVEDGFSGRYIEILIQRLIRRRGRGFGNIRALETAWSRVMDNQARRLQRERASGLVPDYFYFTKEDIVGPEPATAIRESEAWKELMALTGLKSIKDSIRAFVGRLQLNHKRELSGKQPIVTSLNRVFLGSPGTGKTTVAKLYARILADIGLLSSRDVLVRNPSDFIGKSIGHSEYKTRAILQEAEGKVLVIDEGYMLIPDPTDPTCFRRAVVDTLVGEVQSVPGEDRCVILVGYKEEMEKLMANSNQGLARRFRMEDAFHFESFDDEQLREILDLKLSQQGLEATEKAKEVAIAVLSKSRARPGFGNAGEVENILGRAKEYYLKRKMVDDASENQVDIVFEPQDFDEEFDRGKRSCRRLFSDVIDCEDIINKLEGYLRAAENMRIRGMDPRDHLPFNFIFKGPPGTGKTTMARKMGQVFYDMGMLSSSEVIECSVSDLIGEYIGETAIKTAGTLRKSLGRVLFIDEAYRLLGGRHDSYEREAIGEIVDSLTKPEFKGRMIVILAGYSGPMNKLLQSNPGLSSRFPDEVVFRSMTPCRSIDLLIRRLGISSISIQNGNHELESSSEGHKLFRTLSTLPSWGNGRDIETISKNIFASVIRNADPSAATSLTISCSEILAEVKNTLQQQTSRLENAWGEADWIEGEEPGEEECCHILNAIETS